MAPALQQSAICSGAVKIFWDQPIVSNGADVKQATVCLELPCYRGRVISFVDVLK